MTTTEDHCRHQNRRVKVGVGNDKDFNVEIVDKKELKVSLSKGNGDEWIFMMYKSTFYKTEVLSN